MNFKSKQQLLNYIFKSLYDQGKQSKNETGDCLYRGSNGIKCAIGCILPDKLYNIKMENLDVDGLIENSIYGTFNIPWYIKRNKKFLSYVQTIHDNYQKQYQKLSFKNYLKKEFIDCAKNENLKYEWIKNYKSS
jgi:hypothetical protein